MRTRTLIWIGVAGVIAWYLLKQARSINTGSGVLQQRQRELEQLRINTWSEWQSPSVVVN